MPKSDKSRPSSTPGRTKGSNCHRSQLKNQHALDTRFYRKDIANYVKACELINAQKGNQKSGWIEEYKQSLLK